MLLPDLTEEGILNRWIDEQTRHLDLVASWPKLCSTYEELGFSDDIDDETRVSEFKFVIGETNKMLSRMRRELASAQDVEAAILYLQDRYVKNSNAQVKDRKSVVYQAFKQSWMQTAIVQLMEINEQFQEEVDDDWRNQ